MKKINKALIYIIIISILTSFLALSSFSANISEVKIKDMRDLEKYERKVIKKLTGREYVTPIEERIKLHLKLYGGPGMIIPVGSEDFTKVFSNIGFMFNIGVYFNLSSMKSGFLKDFYMYLEIGLVFANANSVNKLKVGTKESEEIIEDGSLMMIPVFIGVLYEFKLSKKFYLGPTLAVGLSYNKIELPSKYNDDGTQGLDEANMLLAFKGGIDVRYSFTKSFSIEGSLGMIFLIEPQSDGSNKMNNFLYFSVFANLKF